MLKDTKTATENKIKRTGTATVPLDYGRCPRWLFERMTRLGRSITQAIVEEFGPEEFLKRLSDPVWFQSLGCVMGFDWNSSGLTVTTLGALKVGLFEMQDSLEVYVCGGKKESRKTPEEITAYGISRGLSFAPDLIYASKMAAKVDASLIQSGHQLYHHNFLFTKKGTWAVIQQGMNIAEKTARRYHWLATGDKINFTEEPHRGIAAQVKTRPLNLVAKTSRANKEIATALVREEPSKFLKDIKLMQVKSNKDYRELTLFDKEFDWHPVVNEFYTKEKFNLKRLEKTINLAKEEAPKDFEALLALKGIGPRTIRALSLVSEVIYGAKPSYQDPARYSFAVGGKDGTPFPVDRKTYDKTLAVMEQGIKKSKISLKEKDQAQDRLNKVGVV